MILFFIYTKDLIQRAVKMETSLLAERRPSPTQSQPPSGSPLTEVEMYNDTLVMDEEYEELFRRLFFQAHAEVILHIPSNYLTDTPTDLAPVFREFPDFRQDRDFALWLRMHDDFPVQYKKSIDIKIEQLLIDYICYRWFETKSPQDAMTYYSRLEPTADEIKRLLVRKEGPMRRLPSLP